MVKFLFVLPTTNKQIFICLKNMQKSLPRHSSMETVTLPLMVRTPSFMTLPKG